MLLKNWFTFYRPLFSNKGKTMMKNMFALELFCWMRGEIKMDKESGAWAESYSLTS
jgi:hypothetical protein